MKLITTGSAFTNDIHEMERWLNANEHAEV